MIQEKLHYKKINDFMQNLNKREKKYIIKKLKNELFQDEMLQVNFTINNQKIC